MVEREEIAKLIPWWGKEIGEGHLS